MRVIAGQGSQAYLRAVVSAVLKLIALLALLLIPVGVATAPAAAQLPAATAASGHCDEHQQPADAPADPQVHCTACSALPAAGFPAADAKPRPQPAMLLALSDLVSGIEPETATPPPKRA